MTNVAVSCGCTNGVCSLGGDGALSVSTPTAFSTVETSLSSAATTGSTTLSATSATGISAFDDLLVVERAQHAGQ